jgi:hypothetical protein
VPFLRLNRDRRGYESTFLLHTPHHGARPRVLYWYRTAPGVRVGRPPLDEDAIRTIEEQHPDVDFNWSEILAVGAAISVEIEPPTPPRRRGAKPPRERGERDERRGDRGERGDRSERGDRRERPADAEPVSPAFIAADDVLEVALDEVEPGGDAAPAPPPRAHDLLEGLVGREIATRLHARYAELSARISELSGDEATREAWRVRTEPLNPDLWVTPDEILSGVQRADALFDQVRNELREKRS